MSEDENNDQVTRLHKDISQVVTGKSTADIVRALTIVICDVLMTTGPNLYETLKVIDTLKQAMTSVITDCDKSGVCCWNDAEKIQ